jgi:hypothetical protein
MDPFDLRMNLLGLGLFALAVVPMALYRMNEGGLVAQLLVAALLLIGAWGLMMGSIGFLLGNTLRGLAKTAGALLMLFAAYAAGVFEAVGL